ncbi:MAG: hypothetical protein ABWX92_10870 [Mycetocola sp.]
MSMPERQSLSRVPRSPWPLSATFAQPRRFYDLVIEICSVGYGTSTPASWIVRGMLERSVEEVTNLLADRFEDMPVEAGHRSRDFR